MRGEDIINLPNGRCGCGSPPHARGRLSPSSLPCRPTRITPACAGKTGDRSPCHNDRSDHPRMRGEDLFVSFWVTYQSGSPPHARGRLVRLPCVRVDERITPACAGKTTCDTPTLPASSDHPRMRGEDFNCSGIVWTSSGSPPHARGRLEDVGRRLAWGGITPACAGKTPGS